jgi:hypothetical protein
MPPDIMTLQVLQVLNGPEVARIRFRFPIRGSQVTITPQTFQHVVLAIHSGKVKVRPKRDFRPGISAQYDAFENVLEVKRVAGRVNEAYVVHESLHAAYDLLLTGIDDNAEESSAYICMTGLRARVEEAKSPIWHSAGRVALKLLEQYQKGDPGIPMVDEHEWRLLRTAVGLSPDYADRLAGILTGWVLGMQSLHDG